MICGTSALTVRTGRLMLYVACVEVPGDYAACNECIIEYERGFLASLRKASLNASRAFSELRLLKIN